MREVTGNKSPRKPKYHGRIKCASCRRWMRPEPDAKTLLRRRPSPLAAWCVECPVGLILKSTRSNANEDARRDFDDFDVNEELCRARRALHEVDKGEDTERSPDALHSFAAECFLNIDEWLSRGGDLPSAWRGRFPFAGAMPPRPVSGNDVKDLWVKAVSLAKTVTLPRAAATTAPECACAPNNGATS